ncbi:MAG TPA: substrate-binding domain-containing protein [Terriglobales bacterium]|nr:substrate-binding domain-containing protein [Terriglobales bacterium]
MKAATSVPQSPRRPASAGEAAAPTSAASPAASATGPASPNRYLVKSVVHAAAVLAAFRKAGEELGLREVVARSGLSKGICFRILYTLHECGMLEKLGENQYRLAGRREGDRRKFRVGYADQDRNSSFSRELFEGLVRACQQAQVELITVDNRRDPESALKSAGRLIHERVDVAIEFQIDERTAPSIAERFQAANVPLIAIDIPHPGAIYYGVDNYAVGLVGGHCLGNFIKQKWHGIVDEVLLLEISRAGSLVRMRTDGILAGLEESLPAGKRKVERLDGKGEFKTALEQVRRHLRGSAAKRIAVGAANDPMALAAVRAFQECGRAAHCAVVGQNAEPEVRAELRQAGTPLVGSVATFPERYGEAVMKLATELLLGKHIAPATFTTHQLITPQNVDRVYPNDALFPRFAREYN